MTHPLMRGIEALEDEISRVRNYWGWVKETKGSLDVYDVESRDCELSNLQGAIDVLNDAVKKDIGK